VFWRRIPTGQYDVFSTDIDAGVDCRSLPYEDESIDCVVFDPPYTGGFYRKLEQRAFQQQPAFQEWYCHDNEDDSHESHASMMALYIDGATEAFRVLKPMGIYIVKCQDEVENHVQNMTHVDIIVALRDMEFYCRDLFVVVRNTQPHGKRIKQQRHARKNHSYFLVFVKVVDKNGNYFSPRL